MKSAVSVSSVKPARKAQFAVWSKQLPVVQPVKVLPPVAVAVTVMASPVVAGQLAWPVQVPLVVSVTVTVPVPVPAAAPVIIGSPPAAILASGSPLRLGLAAPPGPPTFAVAVGL